MIGVQVGAQALDHFVFVAIVQFFLNFFQSKVDNVVMMELLRREHFAETQPETMEKIDFVACKVGRVGAEYFVNLVAVGKMDFQIELRLLVAELLPPVANLTSLFFSGFLRGMSEDDSAGFQRGSSAEDAVPQIIGSDNSEANGLASFFGHGQGLRKKMLLDAAKKLVDV